VTAALHTLHPGDVACGTRGDRLETLLGSCVSIVLTDPRRTVGAMCHVVHAQRPAGNGASTGAHGPEALSRMFTALRAHGIDPLQCEAYVYGGGNMFPDLFPQTHVGDHNVRWALEALAGQGVPVVADDVGGCGYRRLSWTVGPAAPRITTVPV